MEADALQRRRQAIDMTGGPMLGGLLRFSLPLMLSNVLQVLFNMSDVAVVGRFAGSSALGAVGSTSMIVCMFTGFLIGIGTGVNVFTARFLGARDEAAVRETVHTSLLLSALLGLATMGLGLAVTGPLLRLLGTRPELIADAARYLRIYLLGMPGLTLYNYGNAVLSAHGDTRRPVLVLLAAGLLNVGLNLLLVIRFSMGVRGVALASAVSQSFAAAAVLLLLRRLDGAGRLTAKHLRFAPDKARAVLILSLSTGLSNAIFYVANLFIQGAVNTFDAATVAGIAAATNSDSLVFDVMTAVYAGGTCFISNNLGAGRKERLLPLTLLTVGLSFGIAAVMSAGLLAAGPGFLGLFTTDPAVIRAGMIRLRIMGLCYPLSALMDGTIAASRGLGRAGVPMLIVLIGSCLFRILWIFTVFTRLRTVEAIYLLYPFSWLLTAAGEIAYFLHCYRRIMRGKTAGPLSCPNRA